MDDEKVEPKVSAAQEEEFFLDVEPGNSVAQEGAGPADSPPGFTIREVPEKSGGAIRLLLLLLLVAAAGGFYFFGQEFMTADAPVVKVAAQKPGKIKVPVRTQGVETSEAVKEEVVTKDVVAAVTPKVADVNPPPIKVAEPPKIEKLPVAPAFTLVSGSYLYRGSLARDIARIEKLGYKVERTQKAEPHNMTRLLVGHYPKALAKKRLAEVREIADGAFLVAEKGQYAVYAGSFLSLDKARRTADLLYQQGVRVEELQVKVDLPRTTLHFGSFTARSEAQKAVEELRKTGVNKLKVMVQK